MAGFVCYSDGKLSIIYTLKLICILWKKYYSSKAYFFTSSHYPFLRQMRYC